VAHVPHAQRREQLIAATIEVMATSGLDTATSRRIAEAAEAPLASIHYTFGTLESLISTAYAEVLEEVRGLLDRSVPRTQGFGIAMESLADAVADLFADPRFGILLIDLNPAGDDRLLEVGDRYYDFGPELVRSVATESGNEPPLDPDQFGRLIMAGIDGVGQQFSFHHDPELARTDLRVLLGALARP